MKIREFYAEIGQDYEMILNRMMGNEVFVGSLLQAFQEDQTFEQLKDAVRDGTTEEIFAQAHTLKGMACNLGLKPVCEAASVLVELTRQGVREGAGEAFEQIERVYTETLALLGTAELGEGDLCEI